MIRLLRIMVDTLDLLIASRVEPAGMLDRRAGARLVAGVSPLWPTIRTAIADAGHASRKLAAGIQRHEGWRLLIIKRSEPTFKVVGLTASSSARSAGSAGIAASRRTTSSRCRPRRR